jgi:hypothetical protein
MLALSQPSPNDDSRNGWLFEHPARGHVCNGHTVLASNLVQRRQNRLEGRPPSDGVDEALVLRLAPILDRRWLGRTHPPVRQEASPECAIGQHAHAGGETESAHVLRSAAVEKGEGDLVRYDREAVLHQQAQVVGIEIRHAEMEDASILLQRDKLLHSIDVAGVFEHPPMELQEVNGLDPKALQALGDTSLHDVCGHRPRRGAPLGESRRMLLLGPSLHAQKTTGDQLRTAVVVGHIEAVKAVAGIVGHGGGCRVAIQEAAIPLHIGHLPKAGDHTADLKPGCEQYPIGGNGHGSLRQMVKAPRRARSLCRRQGRF